MAASSVADANWAPSKHGVLLKQRDFVQSWRERYFVLDGKLLTYYEHRTDRVPRGALSLTEVRGCVPACCFSAPAACSIESCFDVAMLNKGRCCSVRELVSAVPCHCTDLLNRAAVPPC